MNMHFNSASGTSILTYPKAGRSSLQRIRRLEASLNDNRETASVTVIDAWYHQAAIDDDKGH